MHNNIAKTTAILIFTLVLYSVTALGQVSAIFYDGIQTAGGTTDPVSGFVYGNTFVMSSTGEWDKRYLTVSINYRTMFQGVGVTGGTWSLNVIGNDGAFLGSIFGDVISGDIQFTTDKRGKTVSKSINLILRSAAQTSGFATQSAMNPLEFGSGFYLVTNLRTLETTGRLVP